MIGCANYASLNFFGLIDYERKIIHIKIKNEIAKIKQLCTFHH